MWLCTRAQGFCCCVHLTCCQMMVFVAQICRLSACCSSLIISRLDRVQFKAVAVQNEARQWSHSLGGGARASTFRIRTRSKVKLWTWRSSSNGYGDDECRGRFSVCGGRVRPAAARRRGLPAGQGAGARAALRGREVRQPAPRGRQVWVRD